MSLGASLESWASCSSLFTADATNAPKGASAGGVSPRGLGVAAGSENIKNAIASMNEPLGLRRACSKSRTMRRNSHKRSCRLKYLDGSSGIDAAYSARTAAATAKPACLQRALTLAFSLFARFLRTAPWHPLCTQSPGPMRSRREQGVVTQRRSFGRCLGSTDQ